MGTGDRAERVRRSIKEGKCASCGLAIPGWPERKGIGDNRRGRFYSIRCVGDMYGAEYVERHKKRLKASEN